MCVVPDGSIRFRFSTTLVIADAGLTLNRLLWQQMRQRRIMAASTLSERENSRKRGCSPSHAPNRRSQSARVSLSTGQTCSPRCRCVRVSERSVMTESARASVQLSINAHTLAAFMLPSRCASHDSLIGCVFALPSPAGLSMCWCRGGPGLVRSGLDRRG